MSLLTRYRRQPRVFWLFGTVVLLQVVISFLSVNQSLSFDESTWQYIGRNWLKNDLTPYEGGVDNKSPLMFLIYGISDLLFGTQYWFSRLLAVLIQTLGIYFLYRCGRKLGGPLAGKLVLLFYGLSVLWKSVDAKMVGLTQTYEITLLIISFYGVISAERNRTVLWSGVLAGLAIDFRYTALLVVPVFLVWSIQKGKPGAWRWYLSGTLAGVGAYLLLLWMSGISIGDLLFYSYAGNFGTGSISSHSPGWKLEQFTERFFYSQLILFYPMVLGYFILVKRPLSLFVWVLLSFGGVVIIGLFAKAHLKEILPPLSLCSGLFMAWLINVYHLPARAIALIATLVFFPKNTEPLYAVKKLLSDPPVLVRGDCNAIPQGWEKEKMAGKWIKERSAATDKVFVAGYSAKTQVYSERISPSIYFSANQTPAAKKRLFSDLSAYPPDWVLLPTDEQYERDVDSEIRNYISMLLETRYREETCLPGYRIYKRK